MTMCNLEQSPKAGFAFQHKRGAPSQPPWRFALLPLAFEGFVHLLGARPLRLTLALCVLAFPAGRKKKIRWRGGVSRRKKGHYAFHASFARLKKTGWTRGAEGGVRDGGRRGLVSCPHFKGGPFPGVFVHDFLSCRRPFVGL